MVSQSHISGDLNPPIRLGKDGFDPRNEGGYNIGETNFVLQLLAQAANAGFVDTLDLLRHGLKREHTQLSLLDATEDKSVVAVGEVFFYPNDPGGDMQMLDAVFSVLREYQQGGLGPRKIVMPVTIAFKNGEKDTHGMVLLIEEYPEQSGHYRIAMLEQHACHDGSKLDFSKEKQILRAYLQKLYPKAEIIENKEPFCSIEKVCGIVSLELCNRLLMAKDAFALAKNTAELRMAESEVQGSHDRNVKLAKRAQQTVESSGKTEGFSPSSP